MSQILLTGTNPTDRQYFEVFKSSSYYCKIFALCAVVTYFTMSTQYQSMSFLYTHYKSDNRKYVGLYLNRGRIGNQIYQLMTGYGIARKLKRTHYLSIHDNSIALVAGYLRDLRKVFPRLHNTFVISPVSLV
ncbi:hypothetical protein OESDEN_02478 [Oesophagostomum dentatum]|uniref:Uncharacterized protein n=1 Tax=Oesophagostomum dentatum TaxID=61180 RepID=A0A0B1TJ20_OESDE|nr:hypothetical protein OESDEN_02478 [Oesophagostomum dentatum]